MNQMHGQVTGRTTPSMYLSEPSLLLVSDAKVDGKGNDSVASTARLLHDRLRAR